MRTLRRRVAAGSAIVAVVLAGWGIVVSCIPSASSGFIDVTDLPDGGLPVNPQVVACGGATCRLADDKECCSGPGAKDGGQCMDADASCPPSSGLVTCNETADCPPGQLCCAALFAGDGGYVSAACAASCPAPRMQLCRTNGECSGDRCVVQTCSDGLTYEMCGLSSSATFPCTPGKAP